MFAYARKRQRYSHDDGHPENRENASVAEAAIW